MIRKGNGHKALRDSDFALMDRIEGDLPILSDVCRADLLLCRRIGEHETKIIAQARPHSSSPLYEESKVGNLGDEGLLQSAGGLLNQGRVHSLSVRGASIAREVYPVYGEDARLIGCLVKDAYWLAYERHKRRAKAFQRALDELVKMVLRGELECAGELTPFREHDGIMFVGPDRRIRYVSGICAELYRHIGYRDSLLGRRVSEIDTIDHQMASRAINEREAFEVQSQQNGYTWVRKVLPIITVQRPFLARLLAPGDNDYALWRRRPKGALILVHDATEALRTRRELESKMALVQEVHHRVKNNLQVVASIMRMQARRTEQPEARELLEESVNRILSVAVVHEFLSQDAKGKINLREVANRIASQVQEGLVRPGKRIGVAVTGPDIWLPAERATQCALVINELVQNAIEHGLVEKREGQVTIEYVDHGNDVSIVVDDDGQGLPEGFDLSADAHLGLQIVRSMVERDLNGEFTLYSNPSGTQAVVKFEKTV